MSDQKRKVNILIGVTGSVASIKLPLLIELLSKADEIDANIEVVATDHAVHFFNQGELEQKGIKINRDVDEWSTWKKISDSVLHVELRRWADIMVIAPLDANTMAKLTVGMCDNLLTCVVRAWDLKKPLLFCPAMNTHMWNHPVTDKNICSLKSLGYIEVPVVAKKLACGDTGFGAMAEVTSIVAAIKKAACAI